MLTFEQGLAAGLITFYLVDSLQLLGHQDIVLSGHATSGTWHAHSPQGRFVLGRRQLWLPAPWHPAALVTRGAWTSRSGPADSQGLRQLAQDLQPLCWLVQLLAAVLLVALPLTLCVRGTGTLFLLLAASVYVLLAACAVVLLTRRRRLGLRPLTVVKLMFDALICPPMAINLVRRVSLLQAPRGPVLLLARELLPGPAFGALLDHLQQRIQLQIDLQHSPPPALVQLQVWLQDLRADG